MEYANPWKALKDHVDEEDKKPVLVWIRVSKEASSRKVCIPCPSSPSALLGDAALETVPERSEEFELRVKEVSIAGFFVSFSWHTEINSRATWV